MFVRTSGSTYVWHDVTQCAVDIRSTMCVMYAWYVMFSCRACRQSFMKQPSAIHTYVPVDQSDLVDVWWWYHGCWLWCMYVLCKLLFFWEGFDGTWLAGWLGICKSKTYQNWRASLTQNESPPRPSKQYSRWNSRHIVGRPYKGYSS